MKQIGLGPFHQHVTNQTLLLLVGQRSNIAFHVFRDNIIIFGLDTPTRHMPRVFFLIAKSQRVYIARASYHDASKRAVPLVIRMNHYEIECFPPA